MCEFLEIDKILQSIQGALVNNTSKLTEIDKYIKKIAKSQKKLKMILFILKNKVSYMELTTRRARNTTTMPKRSLKAGCKDQTSR